MVDLHLHSTFSDGSLEPEKIVELGVKAGLRAMVLTDHDTTRGCARFAAAAAKAGVATMTGVEISVAQRGEFENEMHVLAYGVDAGNPLLCENLAKIRDGRRARNLQIIVKLAQLGCPLDYAEVEKLAGDPAVVGRPHIAAALVAHNFVPDKRTAFARFIGRGAPAYCPRFRLMEDEAFRMISAAGGVPVLAHPHLIGLSLRNLHTLLQRLKACGLRGLEAYHSEQPQPVTEVLLKYAGEFGLLVTGGSDFHGDFKPAARPGYGFGTLPVPDQCFSRLAAAVEELGRA